MSARLLVGLVVHAARWHAGMAPTRLSYWARPYCWRLDRRHPRWAHRRCRCAPPIEVRLVLQSAQFVDGLRQATDPRHATPPAFDRNCPSCSGVLHTVASRPPRTTHHGDHDCPRHTEET